jgi:hypothetical protein
MHGAQNRTNEPGRPAARLPEDRVAIPRDGCTLALAHQTDGARPIFASFVAKSARLPIS